MRKLFMLALSVLLMTACGEDDETAKALQFLDTCDASDDRCDDTLDPPLSCFTFNQAGPKCTHACTMDEECAAPSDGCNNMGVCKRAK